MNILKATGIILLCYLGCIIVFDLAGVLLVTLLPEPGGRRLNGAAGFGSKVLYYAVWLVAGCLSGTVYSAASFEHTKSNILISKMPGIIFILALLFSAALIVFFYSIGEMQTPHFNYENDYYVPGHRNMTYLFFISFLGVCLLHWIQLIRNSTQTGP